MKKIILNFILLSGCTLSMAQNKPLVLVDDLIKQSHFLNNKAGDIFRVFDQKSINEAVLPTNFISALEKDLYINGLEYKRSIDSIKKLQLKLQTSWSSLKIQNVQISDYSLDGSSFTIKLESDYLDLYGVMVSDTRVKLDELSTLGLDSYQKNSGGHDCNPEHLLMWRIYDKELALKIERSLRNRPIGILLMGAITRSSYMDSSDEAKEKYPTMACGGYAHNTIDLSLQKFFVFDNTTGEVVYESK